MIDVPNAKEIHEFLSQLVKDHYQREYKEMKP